MISASQVLHAWLNDRGHAWCANITLATLDSAAGYRSALLDKLPNATLVVDHFNSIKLANNAIDDVRRRVQDHTTPAAVFTSSSGLSLS